MKEMRELQNATEARDASRAAFLSTTRKLRGRLAPRMIAADFAQAIAVRAGAMLLKPGRSKRRRITAAIGGVAAIASAVALRVAQKRASEKKR